MICFYGVKALASDSPDIAMLVCPLFACGGKRAGYRCLILRAPFTHPDFAALVDPLSFATLKEGKTQQDSVPTSVLPGYNVLIANSKVFQVVEQLV
jgi:hypothetical protein